MKDTNITKEARLEDLLFAFRRKLRDSMRSNGPENELTFSQVEVLYFIGLEGEKTMTSIAEHLRIKPPSATEMIKDMERKGFVERKGNTKDRRIVSIVFTPKARKLFTSVCKRKAAIYDEMLSKLTAADRITFERIIRILISE